VISFRFKSQVFLSIKGRNKTR